MKKILFSLLLGSLFAGTALCAPAQTAAAAHEKDATATSTPAGWLDDFEAAKKLAAAENKLLFVDFTGSDWCGWCIRLEKEVLSKKEFLDGVKDQFVLVFVDSPRDKKLLSPAAAKQNAELVERYGIRGFPTVLILTPEGDELAKTGYRRGGAGLYLAHLEVLLEDARKIAALKTEIAEMKPGTAERVAKIDAVARFMTVEEQIWNEVLVREVLDFDPDGSKGLREGYPFFTVYMPVSKKCEKIFRELYEKAQTKYKEMSPEDRKDSNLGKKIFGEVVRERATELKAIADELKRTADASKHGEVKALLEKLFGQVKMQLDVADETAAARRKPEPRPLFKD
ncbi:MAG: thioredoxin family protein [Candidatus Spyradosoma sp.]